MSATDGVRTSQLDWVTTLGDDDYIEVIVAGVNKRIKKSDLATVLVPPIPTFKGARVSRTATVNLTSALPYTVPWQQADIDLGGFFNIANPSRLTVPAGVSIIELLFYGYVTMTAVTERGLNVSMVKNGVSATLLNVVNLQAGGGYQQMGIQTSSGPIAVVPGDYFEARINMSATTQTPTFGTESFFAAKVLK